MPWFAPQASAPMGGGSIFGSPQSAGGIFGGGGGEGGIAAMRNAILMGSLGLLSGRNPQEQFANAAQGFAGGQRMDLEAKQRAEEEKRKAEQKAALDMALADPNSPLKNLSGPMQKFLSVYPDLASSVLVKEAFPDRSRDSTRFGNSPIYAANDKDEMIALQPSSDGGDPNVIQVPEGYHLLEPMRNIDLGTRQVMVGSKTGREAGDYPVDVAGRKAQEEVGTAQGKAQVNLPQAEANGQRMLNQIDSVLNDPALENVTGPWQSRFPTVRGDTARAESKLEQIQGATFLAAFDALRGGGQITEAEGSKATAAYNRLARTDMSDADYKAALREFRTEVVKLIDLARQKAGGADQQGGDAPPDGVDPSIWQMLTPEQKAQYHALGAE